VLVRESYREDGKVKKRTLANLTHLPDECIELLRRFFRGEKFRTDSLEESFELHGSRPYGHVAAVLGTIRNLGLDLIIARRRSRQRDLALALIAARLLEPSSKLDTARRLKSGGIRALDDALGLGEVDENELYEAMDWLAKRQPHIERQLAARHLEEGALALYDLTSTWVEGKDCPLAEFGYSRDRKRGCRQIEFGLLCDRQGRPLAIEAFRGNTADPMTVACQVDRLRNDFGLDQVVLAGDRGMLTEARIRKDLKPQGMLWISALRAPAIRKLVVSGAFQPGLFDDFGLAQVRCEEQFPGERLMVCYNPVLGDHRKAKRESLLKATEDSLRLVEEATRREKYRLKGCSRIERRAHAALKRHKMAKHFEIEVSEDSLKWRRSQNSIDSEAALDGIYVIRTNVEESQLTADQTVTAYKSLSSVERAFRSIKTVDLKVRPIFHYSETRVRAHLLLCMLAYYIEHEMRRRLAPMLFHDHAPQPRSSPVGPRPRSRQAKNKDSSKRTADQMPVHSFASMLDLLATVSIQRVKPKLSLAPEFDMIVKDGGDNQMAVDRAMQLLGVRIQAPRTRVH
jgi:transposase